MNEMTLPSRHRNKKFESWRSEAELSVTEATHNTESLRVGGEETYVFLKLECQSGGRI